MCSHCCEYCCRRSNAIVRGKCGSITLDKDATELRRYSSDVRPRSGDGHDFGSGHAREKSVTTHPSVEVQVHRNRCNLALTPCSTKAAEAARSRQGGRGGTGSSKGEAACSRQGGRGGRGSSKGEAARSRQGGCTKGAEAARSSVVNRNAGLLQHNARIDTKISQVSSREGPHKRSLQARTSTRKRTYGIDDEAHATVAVRRDERRSPPIATVRSAEVWVGVCTTVRETQRTEPAPALRARQRVAALQTTL